MKVAHAGWPKRGHLGRCRAGDFEGHLVLVTAVIDQQWLVYVAPPRGENGIRDDLLVGGDQAMAELVSEWDVEWLLDPEGDRLEVEAFDLRSRWRR